MTESALPVVFTRRAGRQIEIANAWWRENRPLAPNAIAEEIARAIELIALQPAIGAAARSVRLPTLRRIVLSRIGFFLYYRLRTRLRQIEVVAFWHTARGRDPAV